MTKSVTQALQELYDADAQLKKVIGENFPVGTFVKWENGGGLQFGEVLYLPGDRIKVRNHHTNKTYLIHAYRLTPEYNGGRA